MTDIFYMLLVGAFAALTSGFTVLCDKLAGDAR